IGGQIRARLNALGFGGSTLSAGSVWGKVASSNLCKILFLLTNANLV
ncbi:23988_t:CDS:2, partial [Gigaspora rosea]